MGSETDTRHQPGAAVTRGEIWTTSTSSHHWHSELIQRKLQLNTHTQMIAWNMGVYLTATYQWHCYHSSSGSDLLIQLVMRDQTSLMFWWKGRLLTQNILPPLVTLWGISSETDSSNSSSTWEILLALKTKQKQFSNSSLQATAQYDDLHVTITILFPW